MMTTTQLIQLSLKVSNSPSFQLYTDDSQPVTSRANMLGNNTSDPVAKGIELFTDPQNLPNAISTIISAVQNKSKFHPATLPSSELLNSFTLFLNTLAATPAFVYQEVKDYANTFKSNDYNALIDQVANIYEGVTDADLNLLKNSLADMGKSVFENGNSEYFKNLFSLFTLNLNNPSNPYLLIYFSSFRMKHIHEDKSDILEQGYHVSRTRLIIQPEVIRTHADYFSDLTKTNVEEWINKTTSPEREEPKMCFKIQ